MDVDVLKREQDRLQHALGLMEGIIHTVREPLLVVDGDFQIVMSNEACGRLFGEAARGRSFWELMDVRASMPQARAALQRALHEGQPVNDLELDQMTPHGWRKLRLSAQRLWASEPTNLLLIDLEDVTEREAALRSLLAAERILAAGSLTSILAHEINTPLNALTQSLYLLGERLGPADQNAWNYVEIMRHELSLLTQIVREILSLYQARAPAMEMRPADALARAVGLISNRFAGRRIEVKRDFAGERRVLASPDELTQAMANLLAAEERLLEDRGSLHLRVRDGRDWSDPSRLGVRLRIADNAPTPQNEAETRLFEPSLTSAGDQATGVRLWLTRQIVEKYRGAIRARICRTLPGRGRVFLIFLPSAPVLEIPPRED